MLSIGFPAEIILLPGGNPFFIPTWKYCRVILEKGKNVFISTNGTLITEAWAEVIVKEGFFQKIDFSIHGPEGVHDEISGMKGAFGRTARAITAIQRYKNRAGIDRPHIGIGCVVNGKNIGHLEKVSMIAADWGVDSLTFGNTVFTIQEIVERHKVFSQKEKLEEDFTLSQLVLGPLGHSLSKEEIHIYVQELRQIETNLGYDIKVFRSPAYTDDEIHRHYFDHNWVYRKECYYPWTTMRIHPSGGMIPCLGVLMGNIVEEKADRIWNGKKFRKFRKMLYSERLFPACFRCCKLR